MTLKKACEIGKKAGCITVGEAILNIENHAVSLFGWPDMAAELKELVDEATDCDDDILIEEVIGVG